MGRAQLVAAMPLQLLCLQRTKTDPCKNKQCMEELVGKQELSARVILSQTSLNPRTAVAPGPSGHTVPNLTSALLAQASTQRAADKSNHHISAIPQQGLPCSNSTKTAETHAPSPFRCLWYGNKWQEGALGCAVQTGGVPKGPSTQFEQELLTCPRTLLLTPRHRDHLTQQVVCTATGTQHESPAQKAVPSKITTSPQELFLVPTKHANHS